MTIKKKLSGTIMMAAIACGVLAPSTAMAMNNTPNTPATSAVGTSSAKGEVDPKQEDIVKDHHLRSANITHISDGDTIYIDTREKGYVKKCTLGAVLSRTKGVTASHCGFPGAKVYTTDGKVIGTMTGFIPGSDIGFFSINSSAVEAIPSKLGIVPKVGDPVSKKGSTTGVTNGTIKVRNSTTVEGYRPSRATQWGLSHIEGLNDSKFFNNRIAKSRLSLTDMCVRKGDSGAPVYDSAGRVVGIVSATNANSKDPNAQACSAGNDMANFVPILPLHF